MRMIAALVLLTLVMLSTSIEKCYNSIVREF